MSRLQNIFTQKLQSEGISPDEPITQAQIKMALDRLYFRQQQKRKQRQSLYIQNKGQFDQEVAHELWNETVDNNPGNIMLKDYVETLVKAETILSEQIKEIQRQFNQTTDPLKTEQLHSDLYSYYHDHQTIAIAFDLPEASSQVSKMYSNIHNQYIRKADSVFFSIDPDVRQQSSDLKLAFFVILLLLMLQLVLMFQKNHFFGLLGILLMVCVFPLNYFQQAYIKIILIWNAISVIMDLLWVIFLAEEFWFPTGDSTHTYLQVTFLRLVVFFVPMAMILKLVLIGIFFKYRDVKESVQKKINFCDCLKFDLDGKVNQKNRITKINIMRKQGTNPFEQNEQY